MADRKPLNPPFVAGAQIRYRGERKQWMVQGAMEVATLYPGMEATIEYVRDGYQGTLRQIAIDGETGEPILDRTTNGRSVYRNPAGHLCCIYPEYADEWEVVA